MKCPSCGAEAAGKFCHSCGSPLGARKCRSCGAPAGGGEKFCTRCGKPLLVKGGGASKVAGDQAAPRSTLAWWVAGVLMVAIIVVLALPVLNREGAPAPGTEGGGMPGGGGAGTGMPDLTVMPVEEQAIRLFNRVMTSNSAGDTLDVAFFLPKAIAIHEELDPADPDGLYHFALLYLVGGEYEPALGKAREGLTQVPDYLLLLAVAGEAWAALGNTASAREAYARYLEVYDTEMALMRDGYEHHQAIFPAYRDEARAFLAATGGGS